MTAPESKATPGMVDVLAAHVLAGFTICRCGEPVGDPMGKESEWESGHRAHVATILAARIAEAEAAAAERIARAIVNRRIVCPNHHMTDCSPLLNGCSQVIWLAREREEAARIARAARPDTGGAE